MRRALLLMCLSLVGANARAEVPVPAIAVDVDIQEHLGQRLPLDLGFRTEHGRTLRLGELFGDGKPVLMLLEYFRCTSLCDLALQGLVAAVSNIGWRLGEQFRVIVVSVDPGDRPAAALEMQTSVLAKLGRPDAVADWHFLTGDEQAITLLADKLGFRYAFDPRSHQYAHAAAAYVLTPEGNISRYLYGVQYPVRDVKLALLEASQGKIGNFVERVLLTCFRYDPSSRRYAIYVSAVMKGGSTVLLFLMGLGVLWIWRIERARRVSS